MARWRVNAPPPPPVLRSLGCATPDTVVTQEEAAGALSALLGDTEASRKLRALARRSRIATRGSVVGAPGRLTPLGEALLDPSSGAPGTAARMREYERLALPLARIACERAFQRDHGVTPSDVTHLIVVSCTGFLAPGLDVLLARELGLESSVARVLVGFQGCHAALSALRLAESCCRADENALVLVACVELCTLHAQRSPTDDALLSAMLFGDGAAAALVGGAGKAPATNGAGKAPANGAGKAPPLEMAGLRIARTATRLIPDTLGGMAWRVGDSGFEMALSAYVPDILASNARSLLDEMLGPDAMTGGPRFWAVHPGGAAILDALESSLNLPADALAASRAVLARHGNMSSPTVLFVLDELLRRGESAPGIALAFGPGLTVEACLFEPAE